MFIKIPQFFQIFNNLSLPPEATLTPSGDQSTAYTSSACPIENWNLIGNYNNYNLPGKSNINFFVFVSQTFIVVSLDALTINLESGDQAT